MNRIRRSFQFGLRRTLSLLLFSAGSLLLLHTATVIAASEWVQWTARQASSDGAIVSPQPKSAATPVSRGSVVGSLEVPKIDLRLIVLEGTDDRTLEKSIGHVQGTALPGQPGNVGIAGHRNTHFRRLERLRRDDEIRLVTPAGAFTYKVEWIQIFEPDNVQVLDESHGSAVTLVTCYPFQYVGSAPLRYVVRALPVEETLDRLKPAPSSLPTQ